MAMSTRPAKSVASGAESNTVQQSIVWIVVAGCVHWLVVRRYYLYPARSAFGMPTEGDVRGQGGCHGDVRQQWTLELKATLLRAEEANRPRSSRLTLP